MFFNDWWRRDLATLVLRDRNHPSVVMWSIGNEIPMRFTRAGPFLCVVSHCSPCVCSGFLTLGIWCQVGTSRQS